MHDDQKPRIRITIERISVTRISAFPGRIYCEICRRAMGEEESLPTPPLNDAAREIGATATASETDPETGEMK